MKAILIAFIILGSLLSFQIKAETKVFGLSVVPGLVSWPNVDDSVAGLRLSPGVGVHKQVTGIDIGLGNVTTGDLSGIEVGVLFNAVGGKTNLVLLQAAGIMNYNEGKTFGIGLQFAGIVNKNNGGGTLFGAQFALANFGEEFNVYGLEVGLINSVGIVGGLQLGVLNKANMMIGLQVGAVNYVDTAAGVQVGIFNTAKTSTGVQLGITNKAEQVYGLQIGLINMADNLMGVQIGLVNFHQKGLIGFFPGINIGFN